MKKRKMGRAVEGGTRISNSGEAAATVGDDEGGTFHASTTNNYYRTLGGWKREGGMVSGEGLEMKRRVREI